MKKLRLILVASLVFALLVLNGCTLSTSSVPNASDYKQVTVLQRVAELPAMTKGEARSTADNIVSESEQSSLTVLIEEIENNSSWAVSFETSSKQNDWTESLINEYLEVCGINDPKYDKSFPGDPQETVCATGAYHLDMQDNVAGNATWSFVTDAESNQATVEVGNFIESAQTVLPSDSSLIEGSWETTDKDGALIALRFEPISNEIVSTDKGGVAWYKNDNTAGGSWRYIENGIEVNDDSAYYEIELYDNSGEVVSFYALVKDKGKSINFVSSMPNGGGIDLDLKKTPTRDSILQTYYLPSQGALRIFALTGNTWSIGSQVITDNGGGGFLSSGTLRDKATIVAEDGAVYQLSYSEDALTIACIDKVTLEVSVVEGTYLASRNQAVERALSK